MNHFDLSFELLDLNHEFFGVMAAKSNVFLINLFFKMADCILCDVLFLINGRIAFLHPDLEIVFLVRGYYNGLRKRE